MLHQSSRSQCSEAPTVVMPQGLLTDARGATREHSPSQVTGFHVLVPDNHSTIRLFCLVLRSRTSMMVTFFRAGFALALDSWPGDLHDSHTQPPELLQCTHTSPQSTSLRQQALAATHSSIVGFSLTGQ
jgi:hypothetical protein